MSVNLRGIVHSYRGAIVLSGINLAVASGETVAITGPSGSGKTTLLSIAGGLLEPKEGSVDLDGRTIRSQGGPIGQIGWIFQTINLLPRRSALENVAIGLYASGVSISLSLMRAKGMLDRVGLSDKADQLALHLSGGEAQRVAVARALIGRPRLVLADEPTGQLDEATSRFVGEVLFTSKPSETSLILATHDPPLAALCHRKLRLVDGRLRELA